jgi:hypothetical protein
MPKKDETKKQNLTNNLEKLSGISSWFEEQENVDVEEGIEKVKEAASLIKTSRKRLKEIENEFKEIKKEIDVEEDDGSSGERGEKEVDVKDI